MREQAGRRQATALNQAIHNDIRTSTTDVIIVTSVSMCYTYCRMNSHIRTLETKIEALKGRIVALGDLRPGSLSQQYNVCGTPNCRCKASPPQKHGPRYELSYTRKGKSGTRLVKRHELPQIKRAMANYARLRKLLDRWIDLSTELHDLKLKLAAPPPAPPKHRSKP